MRDLAYRGKHQAPASVLKSATPIGFLTVEKELFIQYADLLHGFVAYQHVTP